MMEDSLAYLSSVKVSGSKIITMFGCSGEVYKERRSMGAIAAKYSSLVVLGAGGRDTGRNVLARGDVVAAAGNRCIGSNR